MGFVNQETYQHTDWKAVGKNTNAVKAKYGSWIYNHDLENSAYEYYGKAFYHPVSGEPFENTNSPLGYVRKPWTIDELMALRDEVKPIELDGDWS